MPDVSYYLGRPARLWIEVMSGPARATVANPPDHAHVDERHPERQVPPQSDHAWGERPLGERPWGDARPVDLKVRQRRPDAGQSETAPVAVRAEASESGLK